MREYVRPIVLENEELTEGVYAASGACYTVSAWITQTPEVGRDSYTIQISADHNADHHSGEQVLVISFNQPVTFLSTTSSEGTNVAGSGTNTLTIRYNYHNNGIDKPALGELSVASEAGLAVTGVTLGCNGYCFDAGH